MKMSKCCSIFNFQFSIIYLFFFSVLFSFFPLKKEKIPCMFCTQVKLLKRVYFAFYLFTLPYLYVFQVYLTLLLEDVDDDVDDIDVGVRCEM